MDKRTALCGYLKQYHTGKENAVYSRELERLFSMDGRTLRRKISSLRREGHPICSDARGYYYAASQHEIDATVCRLNQLVLQISTARNGMLYASILSDRPAKVDICVCSFYEEG